MDVEQTLYDTAVRFIQAHYPIVWGGAAVIYTADEITVFAGKRTELCNSATRKLPRGCFISGGNAMRCVPAYAP